MVPTLLSVAIGCVIAWHCGDDESDPPAIARAWGYGVAPVDYCIMHPDGALGSYSSLGELRASLETYGAAGLYDIVEGYAGQRLPGYTTPRWGIATEDRYGLVELIPDFWRQIDAPS